MNINVPIGDAGYYLKIVFSEQDIYFWLRDSRNPAWSISQQDIFENDRDYEIQPIYVRRFIARFMRANGG